MSQTEVQAAVEESFKKLLEESLSRELKPGTLLKATVVAITGDAVIVDAGLKTEGRIPKEEFEGEDIQVGDEVEVVLDLVEDGYGETLLSHEKAKRLHAWKKVEEAYEKGERVHGKIVGRVRGGFTVEIGPLKAFLPGSLADMRPLKDPDSLVGLESDFKIVKLDPKRTNIVVSRKAVLEEEYGVEREELLKKIRELGIVKGIVKNITDYGAFIDLGGIDGLLHITDMAWRRVRHPSEIVQLGQEIEVKVLRYDEEKQRVSLGLKQLQPDPWAKVAEKYPPGTKLVGRVTNITDYGCFVELEDGIEGLVHVSEMDWTNKTVNPHKVVAVGDEVEVMVLEVDLEKRRISLGMKQCKPNPWEEFAKNHEVGEKIRGKIKSITDFGLFVELEGGIDGLVHISDLSWEEPGEKAIRKFRKGEEIEAIILSIEPDRQRIALGIKQLQPDPFQEFIAKHEQGSVVKGVVEEVDAKGAVVKLAEGVRGYLRASEIRRDRVEDARKLLGPGDEVEAKTVGIDRKNRQILLSIRQKELDEERKAMKVVKREIPETPTLGDLFKEQIKKSE